MHCKFTPQFLAGLAVEDTDLYALMGMQQDSRLALRGPELPLLLGQQTLRQGSEHVLFFESEDVRRTILQMLLLDLMFSQLSEGRQCGGLLITQSMVPDFVALRETLVRRVDQLNPLLRNRIDVVLQSWQFKLTVTQAECKLARLALRTAMTSPAVRVAVVCQRGRECSWQPFEVSAQRISLFRLILLPASGVTASIKQDNLYLSETARSLLRSGPPGTWLLAGSARRMLQIRAGAEPTGRMLECEDEEMRCGPECSLGFLGLEHDDLV